MKNTLASRLNLLMEQKNIGLSEVERRTGVKKQSIKYILDNDVKKSSMSLALAEGLGVSYKWLSEGIEDNSFLLTIELNVFNNIYMLLAFLSTKELADNNEKTVTNNRLLSEKDFVFRDRNIFYFCSQKNEIQSPEYIKLVPEKNSYVITSVKENDFTYPIIEKKIVNVEVL